MNLLSCYLCAQHVFHELLHTRVHINLVGPWWGAKIIFFYKFAGSTHTHL